MGRYFYLPCCAGPRTEPSAGLAIVAYRKVLVGEVVTVLDRDQLDDEQAAILARWPGAAPLLHEVEAPPPPLRDHPEQTGRFR